MSINEHGVCYIWVKRCGHKTRYIDMWQIDTFYRFCGLYIKAKKVRGMYKVTLQNYSVDHSNPLKGFSYRITDPPMSGVRTPVRLLGAKKFVGPDYILVSCVLILPDKFADKIRASCSEAPALFGSSSPHSPK